MVDFPLPHFGKLEGQFGKLENCLHLPFTPSQFTIKGGPTPHSTCGQDTGRKFHEEFSRM